MSVIEGLLQRVHEVEPEFELSGARLSDGETHDVLLTPGMVFRFPRSLAAARDLPREVALLRRLQGRLPLAIPNPSVVHLDPLAPGEAFFGYPTLPGGPLNREALAQRDAAALRGLLLPLARFLIALHGIEPATVLMNAASPDVIVDRWHDMLTRIQTRLFPRMRRDAREAVTAHFTGLLGQLRANPVRPTLVHGDFGASNILALPDSLAPIAVVDFSSAGLDDPAVDWAALSTLHPHALRLVVEAFPELERETPRVAFYRGTFALQEALIGAEHDNSEALRAGLADYS